MIQALPAPIHSCGNNDAPNDLDPTREALSCHFGSALLRDIGPLQVEQYKQARIKRVSPATVNREVALPKHLSNLAAKWGSFQGKNPVLLVKFFDEDNDVLRVLSSEEQEGLLQHYARTYRT